jgi:hypothetical protein
MSKVKSHSASASSAAPNTSPPVIAEAEDSAAPATSSSRIAYSAGCAPGRLRIRRVISRRSAAMVVTRKANHQGSTAPAAASKA